MVGLAGHGGRVMSRCQRTRYGFLNFLGDIIMVCLTSGLWLIWIFVREMRN